MKRLGKYDAYVDSLTKWISRVSSVMVWIGFFTLMAERYDNYWLIVIGLVIAIPIVVWFDIKYIVPSKQNFYGNINPYLNEIKKDIKEIKKCLNI